MEDVDNFIGTYFGKWWLFGQKEKVIYGTLEVFSNGSSRLTSFEDLNLSYRNNRDNHNFDLDIIIGVASSTANGKSFSFKLFGVVGDMRTLNFLNNFRNIFTYTCVGKKFLKNDSIHFDEIMFSSESLIDIYTDNVNVNELSDGVNYHVDFRENETIFKDSNIHIFFKWRALLPLNSSNNLKILQEQYINIELSNLLTFKNCLKLKANFEAFISIIRGDVTYFDKLDFSSNDGVVYKILGVKSRHSTKINKWNFVDDIEYLKSKVSSWYELNEHIDFAIKTFYEAWSEKEISVENRFLAYCFSLELIHLHFFNRNKETILSRKEEIPINILKKLKGEEFTWFNKQINIERVIPFSVRLEELFQSNINLYDRLYYPKYSKKIADTRNMLVHLDISKTDIFDNQKMYKVNQDLVVLFCETIKANL
jgi:ApeA N-terminal domain 1